MPQDFRLVAENTDAALHFCGACQSIRYQPERSQILVVVQRRKNEFTLQKYC